MQELKDLGLTDGEIKVYLALLELGPSTNSPIAQKSRMQASSVYYCLNSLINKGFVSYVIKSNRKHFEANEPEHILEIMDERVRQAKEDKQDIEAIIPQLKLHQRFAKKKSLAVVYEGFNGFKTVFRTILRELKKGDSYCAFAIEQQLSEAKALRLFFQNHNKAVKKKGIKLKLLANEEMRSIYEKMYGKRFMKSYQELKYTKEIIPVGITIYKDNVITHVWDGVEPMSFMITNHQVASKYQKYFDAAWKKAAL